MRSNILAFALGVGLLQLQEALPAWPLLAAVSLVALPLLWPACRRSRWGPVLALLASTLLGFSWAALLAGQRLHDRLPAAWEGRDIQVVGVVAALPHGFERGERFAFDVEAVETPAAVVPRRIMLSWYHGWLDDEWRDGLKIRPGERWRFTVRLKRPHGNANPLAFDYEAWLFERGLRATGYVRPQAAVERLDDFVVQPAYAIERLRDCLRRSFAEVLGDATYAGILIALAVGDQQAIPAEQWRLFRQTGVTHLMSISGLHVTMVAALFGALIGCLWRRSERLLLAVPAQKAAIAGGWLAAFAYALLAGFAVPAQRTVYMLTVVALALWSGRNLGASRSLLLALLLVLLLDPWAVLAPGFWLSFAAVALLFFVGTARLGSGRGWRAMLAAWGATQWAVTIGTLPLLLLLFQQFSLVSPLANALAIPLVSFVITPLALLFVVLPWPLLLLVAHTLLDFLMSGLDWLATWPMWEQPAPPLAATLLAVLGVIWLLLPRGFPARWLGLCLLLPAVFWPAARPAQGEAWVEVLDVGQGLAVVVRTAGHSLLYDTGPLYSAESDAGQRIIVPHLRAHGVRRLDALIVTHRDKDHSGGVVAVEEALPIGRRLSSVPELQPEPCIDGQSWEWDGVRFAILHPVAADYERQAARSNHMSCVLQVSSAHGSVLLTADIEARDEQALLARSAGRLRSDVLLVPHHGSGTSSTPSFIAAVGAREAIIPVGYRNRFQHPRADVVDRYAASRLWRTDRDGAVRVSLAAAGLSVAAYRNEYRRYWHGQ
ncbi:DNA internalization-related competence protein ComEC/Rec2 [Accumulibacter sp.]|uniref:DNA internalization-related competence protein ComEC/Rec2 n=1 Tax=Accumulibacter sp. TaxID=2053492 RepID=UPI0025DA770F|nr:DNA internalization-related competence protein ComEC/Rec2 [Accumulibacter sp.]MCM8610882.1 DNA internalization-related competence protein ComEC/Rec2 [Accumulibacter sp.]MCM8634702.1 DNA internalization-related competence protein ComEC/Rec2 [Accumulibacter sp.]MCM8638256.1 DNA internalization-related competence protein ComEC/Rec2 [Accumulibacter sp.]